MRQIVRMIFAPGSNPYRVANSADLSLIMNSAVFTGLAVSLCGRLLPTPAAKHCAEFLRTEPEPEPQNEHELSGSNSAVWLQYHRSLWNKGCPISFWTKNTRARN